MKIDLSTGRDSSARGGSTRHRFHCASCRTSGARHLGTTITTISAFGNILTATIAGSVMGLREGSF
jgi:hypothetical protein